MIDRITTYHDDTLGTDDVGEWEPSEEEWENIKDVCLRRVLVRRGMMKPDMNDYIDLYRQMHAAGNFDGWTVGHYAKPIERLIRETGAMDMLDYGSGKAAFHKAHDWGIPVICYDPAWKPHEVKPTAETFDGVICVDVLEHIPEPDIAGVLDEIFGYARKFVFVTVCCRLAKKSLPNGENCHITIKDENWWHDQIVPRARKVTEAKGGQFQWSLIFTP